VGDEYRSEIFYINEEQKQKAKELIETLGKLGWNVVTRVEPLSQFWPAEECHEDYHKRKGEQPYCHRPIPRFSRGP